MLSLFFVRRSRTPADPPRSFSLPELWLFFLLVVVGVVAGYSLEGIEAIDALVEHVRHPHRHG